MAIGEFFLFSVMASFWVLFDVPSSFSGFVSFHVVESKIGKQDIGGKLSLQGKVFNNFSSKHTHLQSREKSSAVILSTGVQVYRWIKKFKAKILIDSIHEGSLPALI
jgi:hypothetical protein